MDWVSCRLMELSDCYGMNRNLHRFCSARLVEIMTGGFYFRGKHRCRLRRLQKNAFYAARF